jgi:radical SAM-linked protein
MGEAVKRFKVKVTFHKTGEMIYISQLDVNRLLIRALRRAHLPIYYTQGHNPHVKVSYENALKLGIEGTITVTVHLNEEVAPEQLSQRLGDQLPTSFKIVRAEIIP